LFEKSVINTVTFNETLNSVMNKAENTYKCKKLLNEKNSLFERKPESQDALLELDELLSDYYGEVLKIMYTQVLEKIIRTFYDSALSAHDE